MASVMSGYKGIDVDIVSYTKNPAEIAWEMLKQTWIELHDIEYDPDSDKVQKMIRGALEKRLNPTPLETVMIQVVFKNVSRVNLAQLTRHRGWLFNAESQMPQHVNHNVMIPLNIVNSEFCERALKLVEESQKLYDDMTKTNDEGKEETVIPYQDARYLLLHGQTCNVSASFSLPQLVNVCGQRLENNTADEINYAFRILLYKLANAVFEDDEMDRLSKQIYDKMLLSCDAFGAKSGKCFNCDDVFGNSFKRFEDANAYVTYVTENCKADFKKSAWYLELKRILDEERHLILGKSEEDMISSWE